MKEEDKFRDISIISTVRYGGHGRINILYTEDSTNRVVRRRKHRERTDQRLVSRLVFQERGLLGKRQLPSSLLGLDG